MCVRRALRKNKPPHPYYRVPLLRSRSTGWVSFSREGVLFLHCELQRQNDCRISYVFLVQSQPGLYISSLCFLLIVCHGPVLLCAALSLCSLLYTGLNEVQAVPFISTAYASPKYFRIPYMYDMILYMYGIVRRSLFHNDLFPACLRRSIARRSIDFGLRYPPGSIS